MNTFFKKQTGYSHGFSLIELIITVVLLGLFAAMIIPYFKSSVMTSLTYTQRQQAVFQLNSVLSNIITDYEKNYTQDLAGLKTALNTPDKYKTIGNPPQTVEEFEITAETKDIAGGTGNGLYVKLTKKPDITFTYLFVKKEEAP